MFYLLVSFWQIKCPTNPFITEISQIKILKGSIISVLKNNFFKHKV